MKATAYLVHGRVVHGQGRGGAQLGFPTANLDTAAEWLALADGVYACWARVGDSDEAEILPAVASLGTNPHFASGSSSGTAPRVLEVHVMRLFAAPFYGETLHVALVLPRLRAMECFESDAALVQAIHDDVDEARRILAESPAAQEARKLM